VEACRIHITIDVMEVDRQHTEGLGTVHDRDDSAFLGKCGQFPDRVEMASPGDMAERDGSRAAGYLLGQKLHRLFFGFERAGDIHFLHADPMKGGPIAPRLPARGMFLGGQDDLVTRLEDEAHCS
jgi:hypothetical protein